MVPKKMKGRVFKQNNKEKDSRRKGNICLGHSPKKNHMILPPTILSRLFPANNVKF